MNGAAVSLCPIEDDVEAVAEFFHSHHNRAVSTDRWLRVLNPPWPVAAPNRGFQLIGPRGIVGAYLAVYSERDWGDRQSLVCNLAALCVLPEFRLHTVRLMRTLLAQSGLEFTDLSPSGNVVRLNERSGFDRLDTSARLTLNLPLPDRSGLGLSSSPEVLATILTGRDLRHYQDHVNAPAARHLLVSTASSYAYLVFRRDRRKGLPLFASPLYAGGDRELLQAAWKQVASHLLIHHHLPVTLAERRILGFAGGPGRELRNPRPKMLRSDNVAPSEVDYLYSELTLLEW